VAVFPVFLRLGLTSFGGPIAHLGYFRAEFVERRRWLSDQEFGDLVALCQFLPGPTSSQVGFAIGLMRGGVAGGLAAWLGFTLPSAALMIGFAAALHRLDPREAAAWLHGLLIVAVAVVAQAVWGMATNLAPDRPRATMAILAAAVSLALPSPWTPLAMLAAAAAWGRWAFFRAAPPATYAATPPTLSRRVSAAAGILFVLLLLALPLLARATDSHEVAMLDRFYRVGALVFGGGHVVLPMLQGEFVPQGWVSPDDFLAGYAAAQAAPGPLFTFAAFLGAVMTPAPNGWIGGVIAVIAIFLPTFLMVAAALPWWDSLRRDRGVGAALTGVNAAVVGVLLAALYSPVWTSAVRGPADVILALVAFGALHLWRAPPWAVVLSTALLARIVGILEAY
jgi:chromate transporter